jgi:hypothetical protein
MEDSRTWERSVSQSEGGQTSEAPLFYVSQRTGVSGCGGEVFATTARKFSDGHFAIGVYRRLGVRIVRSPTCSLLIAPPSRA